MSDENIARLLADAALSAEPAALRKALAAVLNECDELRESASMFRMLAEDQTRKGSIYASISATRAEDRENAAEGMEETLISAFDLWPAVERGEAES